MKLIVLISLLLVLPVMSENKRYAIVIKSDTYDTTDWKLVAEELSVKHSATCTTKMFKWNTSPLDCKDDLKEFLPDYIAFVSKPVDDCKRIIVHEMYELTRNLDSDPYADALWSIVTGYVPEDAIRAIHDSVTVKTAVGGKEFLSNDGLPKMAWFPQAMGYNNQSIVYSFSDESIYRTEDNNTMKEHRLETLGEWLNDTMRVSVPGYPPINDPIDFFMTSGHGLPTTWLAEPHGAIFSYEGKLRVKLSKYESIYLNRKDPIIYYATGNCLIGKPDDIDNMVYSWFHSGRAVVMFGYMVESGYGYMGWGAYDRFKKFSGVFSATESVFLTNQSLIYDLENNTPYCDRAGLEYYKNETALYGDPLAFAYNHSFDQSRHVYRQELTYTPSATSEVDTFTYTIQLNSGMSAGVGYARGLRPMYILPERIKTNTINVISNNGYKAEILDNMVIFDVVDSGESGVEGDTYILKWTAEKLFGNDTSKQAITITSPGSREEFYGGDTLRIGWTTTNVTGNVVVSLMKNGAKVEDIATTDASKNGVAWIIPEGMYMGYNFTVSVKSDSAVANSSSFSLIPELTILEQSYISVKSCDSEESGDEAAKLLDGDTSTKWHTEWSKSQPNFPHEIVFEVATEVDLSAFEYLPRQDGNENGRVKEFKIYMSNDGSSWSEVSSGELQNRGEKTVIPFDSAMEAKYLKFVAFSEISGNYFASASEVNLYYYDEDGAVGINTAAITGKRTAIQIVGNRELFLNLPENESYSLQILSVSGREIYTQNGVGSAAVRLSEVGISQGVYLFRLNSSVGTIIQKISLRK